jgi:DNA-binding beta-propeller fold protein YncE
MPDPFRPGPLALGALLLATAAPAQTEPRLTITPAQRRAMARLFAEPAAPAELPILTLGGHPAGTFFTAYSPDGRRLATCGRAGAVKVWDADTGAELLACPGHTQRVYSLAFSPDGKSLATAGEDGALKVFDAGTGKERFTCEGHGQDVYNVGYSPDGLTLASCSLDNTVRVWRAADGHCLRTLQGHTQRVVTVSFSPDGRHLASAAVGGETSGEVRVWDLRTGQTVLALPVPGTVTVAYGPDGRRLALANLDKSVRVVEVATGQEVLRLAGHTQEAYFTAFSPDGRLVASTSGAWSGNRPGEVKVWDLALGREVHTFTGYTLPVWCAAFRPDGRRLATASGPWDKNEAGEVRVWDVGRFADVRPAGAGEADLPALWADLAGDDAARADRAVWSLRLAPRVAVPFLRRQVRPVPGVDARQVERLVAALDDNRFAARERAYRELEAFGGRAEELLRAALAKPLSAEARRRVGRLLDACRRPSLAPQELQAVRAVEVLEYVGGPDAAAVLRVLADGPAGTAVVREAAGALERIKRRSGPG